MDAKTIPRGLRLLGIFATSIAFAVGTNAELIGQDSFETSKFSTIWNQTRGATLQSSGGANATRGFASLSPNGGTLAGNLAISGKEAQGLSDFLIDFYFRTRTATNCKFNLRIDSSEISTVSPSNATLDVCYDARNGWGISSDSNGSTSWKPIAGMKPLLSDAWYRFRLAGRDGGTTNAYYYLELSEPNGYHL
jgi:hypothetical protein